MSDFTPDLNYGLHQDVQDNTTLSVGNVIGGGIATVTDIGASLWNSVPGTTNVDTADLLKDVSTDALNVYTKNPDLIHAASFIGGMAIPMGVATKGMNLLRSGARGASWFGAASDIGRAENLANIGRIFEEAGAASKEYKAAMTGFYAKTAVNAAIDSIAMEGAVVGLMHAHPLMEDYMQDFGENFALSAAFGGVIGGVLGHVVDRFALRELTGDIKSRVLGDTLGKLKPTYEGMTNVNALQAQEENIRRLDNIMSDRAALGKTETNDLTFSYAKQFKQNIAVQQEDLFQSLLSDDLKNVLKATPDKKEEIKNFLVNEHAMAGVDNIRMLTEKDVTAEGLIKAPTGLPLGPDPTLKTISSKGPSLPKPQEAVYFPELGLYGTKKDAIHYAGANVYNKTAEELADTYAKGSSFGRVPNIDSALELLSTSSSEIQAKYIAALARVDKMSIDDLKALHIGEQDGPLLHAVVARMQRDPEARNLSIKTGDRSMTYTKIIEEKTQQLLEQGKLAPTGPDATYSAAMDRIGKGTNIHTFDPKQGISSDAREMVKDWIGGDVAKMRRAAVDYFGTKTGGFHTGGGAAAKAFGEIYNSEGSRALRTEFQKLADQDGMVYLYRGLKANKLSGHAPVESYTTHYQKAAQFTGGNEQQGIKLFKVHVDDIIAGFKDVGSGEYNAEILVRAPARPVEAELSDSGKIAFKKEQQVVSGTVSSKKTVTETMVPTNSAKTSNLEALQTMLLAQKQDAIDTLIAKGIPAESIAIKTNTNVATVEAYMHIKQLPDMDLSKLLQPGKSVTSLGQIQTMEDAKYVLDPAKMPLVLKGNIRKSEAFYVKAQSGLDIKDLSDINSMVTLTTLRASKAQSAQEIANVLDEYGHAIALVKAQIGNINNERAGNAFFNSFDFYTRKMGDVGPITAYLGEKFRRVANDMVNRIVNPISASMEPLAKDAVAMSEFNVAMNANAKLTGWRMWTEDGKLVQKVQKVGEDGKTVTVLEPVMMEGKPYQVRTPSVLKLIHDIQDKSGELRNLKNTSRRLVGSADISDIGFWVPSFNPMNKYIAYVHNTLTDETQLLHAKTEGEYNSIVDAYKNHLAATEQKHVQVFKKSEQEFFSLLNGRLDTINMKVADTTMLKGGKTATPIVKSHTEILSEIAGGYQHYITAEVRNLTDLALADVTDPLRQMSKLYKAGTEGQPFDAIKKVLTQPRDSAAIIHNSLLGSPNLGEYAGWQSVNKTFETYLTMASNFMGDVYKTTLKPVIKGVIGRSEIPVDQLNKIDYEKLAAGMEARGVYNPYKVFDDEAAKMFGLSRIEDHKDTAKRLVYASNALAATAALRVGEIAQPLVNLMSMPILTSLAIADRMPQTFMGVQKGTAKVSGVQIMMEGFRAAASPLFKDINAKWERDGIFSAIVSEVNDLHRASRKFEPGATAAVENAISSKLVNMLSKPADYSEALSRKLTMNTGAVLARRLYPDLDDAGITIFARDFMNKALGNFSASQRPVFFQGTLGVALGLFQTYSLTLAQSIYRHLEMKNYVALGKAALLQSAIFGTKSLPGMEAVSNQIGEHFSKDHVDLTTGTYRATGDNAADMILYGLPSNLTGAGFTSRGNADFRPPGLNMPVAINTVQQVYGMMGQVKRALDAEGLDKGRALLQALSLQNMSRPIARGAEVATGYSITQKGTNVQVPEEVWTNTGIAARVMSTRPMEDAKVREAEHLRRFYGAVDRDNRDDAINKIRTAVRNGSLSDKTLSTVADDYLRKGGSPRGWQAAVSTAIGQESTSGKETLLMKLQPNSPLNFMIDHLDGQ